MDNQPNLEARTKEAQKSTEGKSQYEGREVREQALVDYCNRIIKVMGPYYTSRFWGN